MCHMDFRPLLNRLLPEQDRLESFLKDRILGEIT